MSERDGGGSYAWDCYWWFLDWGYFKGKGAEMLGAVEDASSLSVLDQRQWVSGG